MPTRLTQQLRGVSRALSTTARAAHAGCSDPHHRSPSSSQSSSSSSSPSATSAAPSSSAASASAATAAASSTASSGLRPPSPSNPDGARAAATAAGRTHRSSTGTPLNSPVGAGGPGQNTAYCASLVQRLDPDAWLTSYFWPKREREWWLAIRAFNVSLNWWRGEDAQVGWRGRASGWRGTEGEVIEVEERGDREERDSGWDGDGGGDGILAVNRAQTPAAAGKMGRRMGG